MFALVVTIQLPTTIFTHRAADLPWLEVARLFCPDGIDIDSISSHLTALNDNPATADWFFYHCTTKFVDMYYKGVLGATDYVLDVF